MRNIDDIVKEISDFIFINDTPQSADVIFVPGNSSYLPAQKAAELYKSGFAPIIVPSGRAPYGKGRFKQSLQSRFIYDGVYSTECDFMTDILLKNGVPQKSVLGESRAEYTKQNASFSRELLDAHSIYPKRAILCCLSVHARRALMHYSRYFPDTEFCVVSVASRGVDKDNWYKDPISYTKVFSEIEKIGAQFSEFTSNKESATAKSNLNGDKKQ